ncbi:MAG: GDP-mannose 4,6-dehydratase [Gemmatimonadetes bacterium]|nr:GDP-mannose 4,6-dehydratase [Gemmatimonadota bacterium]
MTTPRRILVTGGAGFIGSTVADLFVAQGHTVTVLDNLASGKRSQVPAAAAFVHADVTSPDAARLVREGQFDAICHLAAQIDVRKSVTDPAFDATVNILGALNLLEAVKVAGGTTRVVFASTGGAIYGDFVQPPNLESYAKDPDSPYGIAKLSVEHYMAYYARVHGVPTAVLRYANVYGPRQDPHGEAGVVAIFCRRLMERRAITVFGDGLQTRDYVFVGDVASANLIAATTPLAPMRTLDTRAWNVGTAIETSVVDLAKAMMRVSGVTVPLEHAPARPGEARRSAVSIAKAKAEIGWAPEVGLDDGLAATYRWFLAHAKGA